MITANAMDYVHLHNVVRPDNVSRERRYGIRVTMPPGDPFRRLLGEDWEKFHWYATESERDREFERMAWRHGYYRKKDNPSQVLEKVER